MQQFEAPKKLRGRSTVLPEWWRAELDVELQAYRQRLENDKVRWSWKRLADDLTDVSNRTMNGKRWAWDRKTVERFVNNENPTEELMLAFCALFAPRLIKPTFVAESRNEAIALAAVGAVATKQEGLIKAERREIVRSKLNEAEIRSRGQASVVVSKNVLSEVGSRGSSGRRPKRMG